MKCYMRKRTVWILVSFQILLSVSMVLAQDEKDTVASFEKRVVQFEKFFSDRPKFLEKQSYTFDNYPELSSPTGYIFFWTRYDDCKISYDVSKTDSLVSPYLGKITVKYVDYSSQNCGDIGDNGDVNGRNFSTKEAAINNRDIDSCYKRTLDREMMFVFAYQKGSWVFKEVSLIVDNMPAPHKSLSTVMGTPSEGRFPLEENEFWKVLISNDGN